MKRLLRYRFIILAAVLGIGCPCFTASASAHPSHHHRTVAQHAKPSSSTDGQPPVTSPAPPAQPSDPQSDDEDVNFDPTEVDVDSFPVPPGVDPPTPATPPATPPASPAPPQAPSNPIDQPGTTPQVVTTPAAEPPVAATTTMPVPVTPPKPPPPPCLNHPDYKLPLPQYWYQDKTSGNCFYRGPDAYGLCKGDQYNLVTYADVDKWLKDGYGMGIIVGGAGLDRQLNCLITDLATYGLSPKDFVFSGKYVQDGGPADGLFGSPQPYPWSDWKPLYPYWVPRLTADQYVASQTTESIQAYGLLWFGGFRYQTANAFSKYLRKHHQGKWRNWKQQFPDFAAALVTHQRLLRRR